MLKAYLVPFFRAFMFQIASQSSDIAAHLKTYGAFQASNGWTIALGSVAEIDLLHKVIYLWGRDVSADPLRVHRIWNLSSDYVRDTAIAEIDSALKEFTNSLGRGVVGAALPMWTRVAPVKVEGNVSNPSKRIARAA